MLRPFVIVGEIVAAVADLDGGFIKVDELVGRDRRARRDFGRTARRSVPTTEDRIERVLREDVFDICEQQFLVLLFVINSERQDRLDFAEEFFVSMFDEIVDLLVDQRTVA